MEGNKGKGRDRGTIYGPRPHPLSCLVGLVGALLPKLTTHRGPRVKAALYDANEITTS